MAFVTKIHPHDKKLLFFIVGLLFLAGALAVVMYNLQFAQTTESQAAGGNPDARNRRLELRGIRRQNRLWERQDDRQDRREDRAENRAGRDGGSSDSQPSQYNVSRGGGGGGGGSGGSSSDQSDSGTTTAPRRGGNTPGSDSSSAGGGDAGYFDDASGGSDCERGNPNC